MISDERTKGYHIRQHMMSKYLPLLTFVGAFLLSTHISYAQEFPDCYHDSPLTIWLLQTGYCLSASDCNLLKNCSTLYGSLIIRSTLRESKKNSSEVPPYFPKLREITGFLVIIFYNQEKFNLLPSLAVIRGNTLIYNYAFVVYLTDLKEIYFPELTTILHGGVRIERNSKLCYVETIRWKSIVKDKDQEEKFGIVLEANHMNCDTSCATKKCSVLSGHGEDPTVQYCWGLGNSTDFQCQKFCDLSCGLEGCMQNTTSTCCNKECLGGCSSPSSAYSCNACKHYRVETSDKCVDDCPMGTYLFDNLICKSVCPGSVVDGNKQYLLDNRCVNECPAGYYKNDDYVCRKCSDTQNCERVCKLPGVRFDDDIYPGAIIRVPSDIVNQKLTGCTEIIGSLTFELQKGTGNYENFLEGLKWLRIIRGHIKIHQTPLPNLNFFANLEVIDPPEASLLHSAYAVLIYDNKNLEHMWVPAKHINVTRGGLFAQSNPRLCPGEITKLQESMYDGKNQSIHISQLNNGNQVVCQVERLQMSVSELKLNELDPFAFTINDIDCFMVKCADVKWEFVRESSSYFILFYTIYYLEIGANQTIDTQVAGGWQDNKPWETVEVDKPPDSNINTEIQMSKVIKSLSPNARYAFYVKEILTNGEGKSSKIHYLKVSQGIPTAPLGMEASFLSKSSIRLQWRTPDKPNGEIVAYQIYWQKATYSFWEDQSINWCNRVVKIGITQPRQQEQSLEEGTCRNVSCNCEDEKEISKAFEKDRKAFRFKVEFQERMTRLVFTKEKGTDNDQTDVTSIDDNSNTNVTEAPTVTSATPSPKKPNEPNVNVSGNTFTFDVQGLDYFQDYVFSVCACTEVSKGGGCAKANTVIASPCASAQARTGINHLADNLEGNVNATVDGSWYNISWNAPSKPNAVVLKYEISLSAKDSNDGITICRPGYKDTYLSQFTRPGDYVVKVRAISPAGNGSWSQPVYFTIEDHGVAKSNLVVMAVSVSAVVLILILLSFVIYYAFFKRNTEKDKPGVLYASVNPEYMNASEVYMPDEWELDREKIELIRELGQGSFGMVYEGIAHGIADSGEFRVAVKTVNENASIRDRIEFLQEASIMKAFNSNHVVKLIGVVSQGQPTFVVMELMGRGDLKSFLRSRRPEEKSNLLPPNRQERIQMAAEIADGMAYLAARKFVHRDLAARNCMVAIDFTVKIGDFGMTRDIYETDYYRKGGKGLLPVRWMAPESLRDGLFTAASDVWSYGVVLWEIATLAYQPYQGKSNEEVLHFVLNSGQLVYPENTDDQLKDFMDMCWQRDPKMRPSFLEIIRLLENDVSEDYVLVSFYHEMKRKALEDTLYRESTLLDLLDRPDSCSKNNSIKGESLSSASSVDSGAFIENPKPSIDYTPDLNIRKSLLLEPDEPSFEKTTDNGARNCWSLYDNYGTTEENMKYGDTPVKNTIGNTEKGSKELKLSKIFLRKPVPV